jgi:thiol-disulfide isomerase/thioredoxin
MIKFIFMRIRILGMVLLSCVALFGNAQDNEKLNAQIRSMGKETDPEKNIVAMNKLIKDNQLDTIKDAESIDMMKAQVAMSFLNARKYAGFEKYIALMKNKFNQTSYLNMAVVTLVRKKTDLNVAEKFARQTLDLYHAYKDDPKARPENFPVEDWERFMRFAVYPYNDTYAMALYATGKYKEALVYQEKAFNGAPEEGMAPSAERYAFLLAANGQEEKAFSLLNNMARTGKSTVAMNGLLKKLYIKRNGSEKGFDDYFDGLQKNVQAELKKSFRNKMLTNDAPLFSLRDLNGKTVSLADLKGKIVVLDFWATWCVPCLASFPAMQKLVNKHPEIVFLFIDTQEQQPGTVSRVKALMARAKYNFRVLIDEPLEGNSDNKVFKVVSDYKPEGIPAKVVIDANGKQRFMSTGFTSDTELINEMEAMIAVAKEQ